MKTGGAMKTGDARIGMRVTPTGKDYLDLFGEVGTIITVGPASDGCLSEVAWDMGGTTWMYPFELREVKPTPSQVALEEDQAAAEKPIDNRRALASAIRLVTAVQERMLTEAVADLAATARWLDMEDPDHRDQLVEQAVAVAAQKRPLDTYRGYLEALEAEPAASVRPVVVEPQ